MERKRVISFVMVWGVSTLLASAAGAQDKKAPAGPYGLPLLQSVKEKCMTTDDEGKKLDEIYGQATKNEAESRARAKENGTDGKTLDKYLLMGRIETINKVKESIDREKGKIFDQLCAAQAPSKKK